MNSVMRILAKILVCCAVMLASAVLSTAQVQGDRGRVRSIPSDQVIVPYYLEVSYVKTVHLLFPSPIVYVDLGVSDIIANVPEDAQNILRVKAANEGGFDGETNLSVVCEDGSFYNYNVRYNQYPTKLNIEMQDFFTPEKSTDPQNTIGILTQDLEGENPREVEEAMIYIYNKNRSNIRHLGVRKYSVQMQLKSIYYHNQIYYFHLYVSNASKVSYIVDYIGFKVVDKKLAKRSAMQEQTIVPVRSYNNVKSIQGSTGANIIYALPVFTMPEGKELEITLYERNGGRVLTMNVSNSDLLKAHELDNFRKL